MSIIESLEKSKGEVASGRSVTKMDRWTKENPEHIDDLEQAVEWFRLNRSANFGWKSFAEALRGSLPNFPEGWQFLKDWCERRYGL